MADADFLRAIQADPDDDTPRLVYADWLDERGDDAGRGRAELIRAQCELGRDPRPARRRELSGRVRQLLKAHAPGWLKPLRDAGFGMTPRFRRGFPEFVTMSAHTFAFAGDRLFGAVPTIRAARFPNASNEVRSEFGLAGSPHLARLTEVDLRGMCNCGRCRIGEELRELFASPHAANLSALNVAGNRLDAAGVRVLAASPHLDRLVTLDLSGNAFGPAAVRALGAAPRLAGLRSLALRGHWMGPRTGRLLARSPLAARLARLDLRDNGVEDDGGRAFLAAPRTDPWAELDLRGNRIGPAVARQLRERFGTAVKA